MLDSSRAIQKALVKIECFFSKWLSSKMSAQKKKQTESEAAGGEAKTSAKLDKADRRRKSRAPRLAR